MSEEKVKPFDSFTNVYRILTWAGFYKLLNPPKNRFKYICYQMYRLYVFLIVVGFNCCHITFMVQNLDNMDYFFDTLIIEIPQFNLFVNFLMFQIQTPKINKMNELLHDPIFAANSEKDKELLRENIIFTSRVWRLMYSSISITTPLWVVSHFVRKHLDPNAVVHSYRPFEVNSWARYTCSVFLEVFAVFWTGYGHVALDCLVATYYAQAQVQLKIIKYNLEHLFDADDSSDRAADGQHRYRDVYDTDVKKRFVHYVKRYEKLAWYTREISSTFNYSMSFQFFTAIATICATTFRMSVTQMLSVPFVFLFVYLLIILTEVFLYCYFGNLVQYESQSVVTALYLSDWQSTSPKFRRDLLIAMSCWSKTLAPTVSGIVPLSLDTFVTILKSAYSLYAVNCSLVGSKQQ